MAGSSCARASPVASAGEVAASRSVVPRLFARAEWLIMALGDVYVDASPAAGADFDRDAADPAIAQRASTRVYWLWHRYLFGDPALTDYAASLAGDRSSLVRATAALMGELVTPAGESAFPRFAELRRQVHGS